MFRFQVPSLRLAGIAFVVLAVGVTGMIALKFTHASTSTASLEPENGNLVNNVAATTDSTASGANAVKFGTRQLVFDDEFNGATNASPDTSKWVIMSSSSNEGWGVECYVNDRTHVYQDGQGHLVETATYSPGGAPCPNGTGEYLSGGLNTGFGTGQFNFKYGDIAASIKVPCQSGTGMWPAFWAFGPNWPNGGEIDFLEIMYYQGPNYIAQGLHGPQGASSFGVGGGTTGTNWCGAFHTYGARWTPGQITFTIDDNPTQTYTPLSLPAGATWPFDSANEKLVLNLEVGKSGGTVNNATLPQSMLVDYVRIYAN